MPSSRGTCCYLSPPLSASAINESILPPNEAERLAAVRRYEVLDTPPDGAFDRVTALAARFFGVPISTISIVDHDRIWFKSRHGVDAEEIERAPGLCASAILHHEPWTIENAAIDPRTLDNPLVCGELGLRFYCGVPLTTKDGFNLGTLNVIDAEPRVVTDAELQTLHDLAAIVVDELELRIAAIRAVRARENAFAHIAHDLRSPLTAIVGSAELMNGNGSANGYAETIAAEAKRLDEMLTGLLEADAARAAAAAARETFDLGEVIGQQVELFRAQSRRHDFTVSVPALVVIGDRARTTNVVATLLSNAIKYSPTGGTVDVRLEQRDGVARATVRDEGVGIPAADQARLFERFFRVKTAATSGIPGTGLGLAVAREVVLAQGGEMGFESEQGRGSRFWFQRPLAAGSPR